MTFYAALATLSALTLGRARSAAYCQAFVMVNRLYMQAVDAHDNEAADFLDAAIDALQEAITATADFPRVAQCATARAFEYVRLACPDLPAPSLAAMVNVSRY